MAKEFLSRKGVQYQELDVARDPEALKEMVEVSGSRAVPVLVIDQKVIVGFDQATIEEALKEAGA